MRCGGVEITGRQRLVGSRAELGPDLRRGVRHAGEHVGPLEVVHRRQHRLHEPAHVRRDDAGAQDLGGDRTGGSAEGDGEPDRDQAHDRSPGVARELLEANRDKLDQIAQALLERETIGRPELDAIAEGREMPPPERIVIPSYEDKKREAREKRKGSIFQPRPREVPSAG